MEGNESIESQIFWEVMGTSPSSLILNSVDLILSMVTLAFLIVGTVWLLKSAKPGSRTIALGFAGSIVGSVVHVAYLFLWDGEENVLLEEAFGLCVSACLALWGYGYLRLCGFLKQEQAISVSPTESHTRL